MSFFGPNRKEHCGLLYFLVPVTKRSDLGKYSCWTFKWLKATFTRKSAVLGTKRSLYDSASTYFNNFDSFLLRGQRANLSLTFFFTKTIGNWWIFWQISEEVNRMLYKGVISSLILLPTTLAQECIYLSKLGWHFLKDLPFVTFLEVKWNYDSVTLWRRCCWPTRHL